MCQLCKDLAEYDAIIDQAITERLRPMLTQPEDTAVLDRPEHPPHPF